MINYKWLLSSIILPLYNIILFYIIILGYKYYNNLKEENIIITKKILFIISIFEYFNNILYIISITNISYFLNLILSRSILIILMVLNYIFVKRRYKYNHYIGVLLTIVGIIFLFIGKINNDNNNIIYVIINIISVLMNSISNFLQEKYIKIYKETNVYWMNMWISIFVLIIGIFLFPLLLIPSVNKYIDPNINLYELNSYFNNGFSCYLLGKDNISDFCNYASLWISLYELTFIIIVYLIFNLYKNGSSVYYQILATLKIPISTFISYYLIKNNIIKVTENMSFEINMFDYISLIFITIGSFIYIIKREETEEELPLLENNEI
jgi:hypothetical protein